MLLVVGDDREHWLDTSQLKDVLVIPSGKYIVQNKVDKEDVTTLREMSRINEAYGEGGFGIKMSTTRDCVLQLKVGCIAEHRREFRVAFLILVV